MMTEDDLFRRVLNPDKGDGMALLVTDLNDDEWLTLRGLLVRPVGDIRRVYLADCGGKVYIQLEAAISELIKEGHLTA